VGYLLIPTSVWDGTWVKSGLFTSIEFNSMTYVAWIVLRGSHMNGPFWLRVGPFWRLLISFLCAGVVTQNSTVRRTNHIVRTVEFFCRKKLRKKVPHGRFPIKLRQKFYFLQWPYDCFYIRKIHFWYKNTTWVEFWALCDGSRKIFHHKIYPILTYVESTEDTIENNKAK
jgi:hypothetical protein